MPKTQRAAGIEIEGDGEIRMVPLNAIQVAERPKANEQKTFYNPRRLDSKGFSPEKMATLRHSVRIDGLLENLIVRAFVQNDVVNRVELIAGERRLRSLTMIYEEDLPCLDPSLPRPDAYEPGESVFVGTLAGGRFAEIVEQKGDKVRVSFDADPVGPEGELDVPFSAVMPTVTGRERFAKVAVKMFFNCSDEQALRVATVENGEHEPLSISEEIDYVERLQREGFSVDEIVGLTNTNPAWVSQTGSFRKQLPADALAKLVNGEMKRNLAVKLLSYAPKDRQALFEAAVKIEEKQSAEMIADIKEKKRLLEDEEDILRSDADIAADDGDAEAAAVFDKKAEAAHRKLQKEQERLQRAEQNRGTLKQNHVKLGAQTIGASPKRSKVLDLDEIDLYYVEGTLKYLGGDVVDPETGNLIPGDLIAMVRRTAQAILDRHRDPLVAVREYMFDNERWERPEEEEVIDED